MDPLARLTQALKDFQIWETLGDKVEKLKAVTGDLAAEPKFQIENAEYTNLLSTIGMFHPSTLSFFFSFLVSFRPLKSLSLSFAIFFSPLLTKLFSDVVFHSGAVVNHALPYSAMRQENVIGTKQVITFKHRELSILRGEGERGQEGE